jgi:hypothetical protein
MRAQVLPRLHVKQTDCHVDTGLHEPANTSTVVSGVRVNDSDHDTTNPSLDKSLRTRWRPPVEGTGLQRHVGNDIPQVAFDVSQRHGFGMISARWLRVPTGDDAPVQDQDAAYWRIGQACR